MLKTIAAAAACSLALAAGTASGAGVMPAGWWHAEINYAVAGVPHTMILDRGRVAAATGTSLTLREQDGSMVQVALLVRDTRDGRRPSGVGLGHPPLGDRDDPAHRRRSRHPGPRADPGPPPLISTMLKALLSFMLGLAGGFLASKAWVETA